MPRWGEEELMAFFFFSLLPKVYRGKDRESLATLLTQGSEQLKRARLSHRDRRETSADVTYVQHTCNIHATYMQHTCK